ncbi:glycoside hydrolase [Streptomyces sp. NBC_00873]|uniref:WD40/YVTN/BNR-like repeat-containing protein n=1 Tax=unclassified Streptomyces TaxID=2593676 RepID=UPI003864C7D2|nr:glycoside hydrolase [Streptomyces sp. NBC_00873]WTA47750.1 glycoside hydrolase [Streptomyces sp. NBC_00842]
MTRRRRQLLAALVAGILAILACVVATYPSGTAAQVALGQDLDKLHRADPGDPLEEGSESGEEGEGGEENPGSAAQAAFRQRAYPGDTITVAQMNGARAAYRTAKGRPLPTGKGQKGTWVTVGPKEAVYPYAPYRDSSSYLPNEYVAGGRTTAVAISPTCVPGRCKMWITAAGGGIWRTDNALADELHWRYLGGPLGINAAGTVTIDRNDATGNTIYVGTGEANGCSSGCVAGVGIYRSTDAGETWTGPLGQAELGGKGIGQIAVKRGDPRTIYVGTSTAIRGMSSTCCSGITRPVPDSAKWGLYKSTDGGATWAFVHNGSADAAACTGSQAEYTNQTACSPGGVQGVELDPSDPEIVYAASWARGIWRSPDGGTTWKQIKPSLNAANAYTRPAFDVTRLPNGKTRMYVYEGNMSQPASRLFRTDDAATDTPAFTDLTSSDVTNPGFAWLGLCGQLCWYDIFVHTPEGHPDMVYVGGSYAYGDRIANKRGLVLSTDAGVSGTDMTFDGTDQLHPNGLHPDQQALATNPNNPFQFFEASDGGMMRSSGTFVDRSAWCDDPRRNLDEKSKSRCRQMLSRIPAELRSINKGLSTLQFISLSVSPHNSNVLQGGTQDNGTWQTDGSPNLWRNTAIGDGGQSGFDVGRPEFRFHTFNSASVEVNFNNGNNSDWIWTGDPINGKGWSEFYPPVISDPKVSGTMFAGAGRSVYRTKTFGLGDRTLEEANRLCNSRTRDRTVVCGDWVELGSEPLNSTSWGDRSGHGVVAVERTTVDTATAWAATATGRLFISHNVDAESATSVSWTRIDDDAVTPNRFISSIHVDPADGNHAWISYSGFDSVTPTTPGHVFEVRFDPATGKASWTDRSYDFGDLPANDLVRDDANGDLYAATDFGVLRLAAGTTTWTKSAPGIPNVEVAGLTVVPGKRILYAATHGLGAWRLNLGSE